MENKSVFLEDMQDLCLKVNIKLKHFFIVWDKGGEGLESMLTLYCCLCSHCGDSLSLFVLVATVIGA